MQFPEGTKFNSWVITSEIQKGIRRNVVRRWAILPNGKKHLERLPVAKYVRYRDNPEDLEKFVIRLNDRTPEEVRSKQVIKLKHAYIDDALLEKYLAKLIVEIPERRNAITEYGYLRRYFLNFFINKLGKRDPLQWKLSETEWAEALLNRFHRPDDRKKLALMDKGRTPSEKVLRATVNQANRFMSFLHEQRPDVCPPIAFSPISKAAYKHLEASRVQRKITRIRKRITENDWKLIVESLPDRIAPFIHLGYELGLRRAEMLGVEPNDVRRDIFRLERQLKALPEPMEPIYGPPKGRKSRDIPYWFTTPKAVYAWIKRIHDDEILVHPDTLTEYWKELMRELRLDYDIHDLRHTWCTRAGRRLGMVPRDLQLAAGHKDLRTTMKYMHDDRALNTDLWTPEDDD